MDQQGSDELRRELALDQAIGAQLDKLVRRANLAVLKLRNAKMEENQLRNLLDAAMESGSVEVTAGFIRYQIGRDSANWKDFGHHVISDLGKLGRDETEKVVDSLKHMSIADADALKPRIQVRLMQLYLGYINRAFVYAKKANGFDHLKEVVSVA
ncbi:hypothetical protein [Roseiflexus castenholzii]|jgi:hypothetical protein|uniref:Uncharacterized protein n=1 Tax=Roseiflexus castenholzii (strain DSM 13941 / HLO8) TaxID=383372 RepID=A7NFU1_ROSCS|nr:hypothetical protein [Roseiflexus castenholzii]ABU56322.1 conserved hypothetical protein [Roseiflexus castenholzii DSM 13941]